MATRNGPTLLILFAWMSLGPCLLPAAPAEAARELLIEKRFLNLISEPIIACLRVK